MKKYDREEPARISRRELGRTLMASAAIGFGGALVASSTAQAELTAGQKASLSKVLIERLLNTRYYIDSMGTLTVYPQDEVWAGNGGALHQAWLLDPETGLKADVRGALEQSIYDLLEHEGLEANIDLTAVESLFEHAAEIGILDELNTIYWVLKEKILVETIGAYDKGVEFFVEWVSEHPTLDAPTKELVEDVVLEYLSQPVTNNGGDWY